MKGFDEYYDEAVEPDKRERAFAWATAIGLQDVDGLKPSKYLIKTAKRHIEGEITAAEARKLVDEYYETKLDHDVSAEYGSSVASAVTDTHRRNESANVGINVAGPSCGTQSGPSRGTQSNEEWSLVERIVLACEEPKSVKELLSLVGRTNRTKFKQRFLGALRIDGVLEWTIPDKPNSRLQKYRLTAKGWRLVASLKRKGGRK